VKLRDLDSRKITVDCDWVYQNEQRLLLVGCQAEGKEKDTDLLAQLNAVSTVRCDSAMFRLCYGGSPYGQFCTCTVDMMHAFEHGVVVYVLKAFVSEISTPKRKQLDRLAREMFADHRSSEKDTYPRTNFTKAITHMKLMKCYEWPGLLLVYMILAQSYKGAAILNNRMDDNPTTHAKRVDKLRRNAKKKYKKTSMLRDSGYPAGFGSVCADTVSGSDSDNHADCESSTNADQSSSNDSEIPDDASPRCTTPAFVTLMAQLLTFHAYYKQDSFWKKNQPDVSSSKPETKGERELDRAMQVMLRQLVSTLGRNTGYGWNIQKVHEVFFHLVRQIRETGRPSNSDCQVGERGLKVWGKHDSQRTNKGTVANFNKQISTRIYEHAVMARAQLSMGFISQKMKFADNQKKPLSHPDMINKSFMAGHPKYYVYLTPDDESPTVPPVYQLFDDWVGQKHRSGELRLPRQTLQHFGRLYFRSDDNGIYEDSNVMVSGYTEYKHWSNIDQDHITFRAHPNLQNAGQLYDWVIIPDPNDNVDLRYGKENAASKKKKLDRKNATRSDDLNFLDTCYGRGYVPARIVALFQCPETKDNMAIVHACRPWMQMNAEKSSVITESWHLQHQVYADGLQHPVYNCIETNDFVDRAFVIMESPNICDNLPNKESSWHVILVTRRSEHWAPAFLKHK
jgi:hypothetical protein